MNAFFSRRQVAAAALAPAFATLLFVQACGGSGSAVAQGSTRADDVDRIVGVWEAEVTLRDCTTQAVINRFRGSNAMHHGGTMSDTNSSAPASRGPGMGVWRRNTDGSYDVRFRFYRYNADGSLAGTAVVTSRRTLSADGQRYEGDTASELFDTTGRLLGTACVTDAGTRFE